MKRTYTTEQLKKMSSKTDYKRVQKMKDKDIDYSDSPDVSELLIAGTIHRVGRPTKEVTKQHVNLRLDPEIIAGFKSTGPKWQTLINDTLRDWLHWRNLL